MNKADLDKLPLVEFEYPDSESDWLVKRMVRVTEMDIDYVMGYEIFRGNRQDPKYKKFSLGKIVSGGVHLVQFSSV